MISIRASSLPTYAECPRMFAANYLLANDLYRGYGFDDMQHGKNNVGALIGSACHLAAQYIMGEIKRVGGKTQSMVLTTGVDAIEAYLDENKGNELIYDKVTPQSKIMDTCWVLVTKWFEGLDINGTEPQIIESGYSAEVHEGLTITGTVDMFMIDGKLIDLKFGAHEPKALPQMGCYDLILQANSFDVKGVEIHWTQRVPSKRLQPPTMRIPVNRTIAQNHAMSIINRAYRDIDNLLDSGDPWDVVANPSCRLCSRKHCSAYGTSFCQVGGS